MGSCTNQSEKDQGYGCITTVHASREAQQCEGAKGCVFQLLVLDDRKGRLVKQAGAELSWEGARCNLQAPATCKTRTVLPGFWMAQRSKSARCCGEKHMC